MPVLFRSRRGGPTRNTLRHLLAGLMLACAAHGVPAEDLTYVVKAGDNPWNITSRYLKGIEYWSRLQDYNRILAPRTIRPGTTLRIPLAWMRGEAVAAQVVELRGRADLRQGGAVVALKVGMSVGNGAILRTFEQASLVLAFPDGSRSAVGGDSEVRLAELRRLRASNAQEVRLELRRGHLENLVEGVRSGGRYTIETPAGIAAVRGTVFRVSTEAGQVRAETVGGEVALGNRSGTTRLAAGTGSLAVRGSAPLPALALLPPPDLSALPARIEHLPFSLGFAPVAGAVAYRSRVLSQPGMAASDSELMAGDPLARGAAELPDGRYRLLVRAVDRHGLEGLDAEREIVIDARPEPPFAQMPEPDAFVIEAQPEFRWTGRSEPVSYRFQLSATADFRAPMVDEASLAEPRFTPPAPLPPGRYYWRVATNSEREGQGPFSDPQRFRRPADGPAAEPPAIDDEVLKLRWRAGADGVRYQLQISADPEFGETALDVETNEAELALPIPAAGAHHVRIRSLEPGSPPGPWGTPQLVEVPHDHWPALLILVPVLLFAL